MYCRYTFFGKDNVIAIVDNSTVKEGKTILGIEVIGFNEFIRRRDKEIVIITAFIASKEIAMQLEENGIKDDFICPYMQSGFYGCEQIVETWNLTQYESIAIYEKNPISRMLAEFIRQKKKNQCKVYEITEDEWEQRRFSEVDMLVIIKEEISEADLRLSSEYHKVLNLYTAIKDRRKIDYNYLEKYYDRHIGQRCFLIGNGPSFSDDLVQGVFGG